MGMFDYSVQFLVGDWEKSLEFTTWLLDEAPFAPEESPRGICMHRTGYIPVVWVPRLPRGSREKATLAHECLHATFHLFTWADMPIDKSSEETMCHAMAHLIKEFYEGIK